MVHSIHFGFQIMLSDTFILSGLLGMGDPLVTRVFIKISDTFTNRGLSNNSGFITF